MNKSFSKNKTSWRTKKKSKKPIRQNTYEPAINVQVTITHLGAKGDGLVEFEGRQIHIPYSAPEDRLEAKIAGDRGFIDVILEPSQYRTDPVCKHFGECGGCALQHLNIDYQTQWKQERIIEALQREGISDPIAITPSSKIETATRRRATISVQRLKNKTIIGFKARNTHKIISLDQCHILRPELFDFVKNLPSFFQILPKEIQDFAVQITQCDNGFDVNLVGDFQSDDLTPHFYEALTPIMAEQKIIRLSMNGEWLLTVQQPIIHFDDVAVPIPPAIFLQVSQEGQNALLLGVWNVLAAKNIKKGAHIADLFTGCGAFALPLLKTYAVSAIDNEIEAIAALKQAYQNQDKTYPLNAITRDLFRQPLYKEELAEFDVVIFDPPRAGAPAQVKQLAQTDTKLIIGVSCNPASFARDARLLNKGGYRLTHIQLVDQFLFSPHIELIGTFEKSPD